MPPTAISRIEERTPPAATPVPAEVSLTPTEEEPRSAAQLQADYLRTTDTGERIEAIYRLGEAAPAEAAQAFLQLFQIEAEEQLKLEILSSADSIEGQTEPKLALISVALRRPQPADVRQAAIENLTGIDDRRAIATWQTLLNDRDPEVAETAREQILRLQELEAL